MTRFNLSIALLAALALSGCSTGDLLTSKEPQQTIYSLRPAPVVDAPPSDAAIRIMEIAHPFLPPGMDRDRIALYLNDGQKLDYFAAARWSGTMAEVLQNSTRRTASAALPYVIAVMPEDNVDAAYRLQMKVNEFQPVYGTDSGENPMIVAEIEFTLLALPSDRVLTSFTLLRRGRANENRLDVITAGLEKMLQEIEQDAFIRIDRILRPQE